MKKSESGWAVGMNQNTTPEGLHDLSRGFFYGDGLFETIRIFRGKPLFMPLHWERLESGLKALEFDIPAYWSAEFFSREIQKVTSGNARVKLCVWRREGGLFLPDDSKPNYLITATPLSTDVFNWQETGLTVLQSARVRLPVDALSGLKTLGCTRYVAAALEARAKGVDDVIVLNERGFVSEAGSSNVHWIKGDTVFAPAAGDGQVTGTFQKILFQLLASEGVRVQQKHATFAELLEADEVFLTNAIQGIRWVRFLEGKEYGCDKSYNFNKLTVKYLETFF